MGVPDLQNALIASCARFSAETFRRILIQPAVEPRAYSSWECSFALEPSGRSGSGRLPVSSRALGAGRHGRSTLQLARGDAEAGPHLWVLFTVTLPIRHTTLGLISREPTHGYALVRQLQQWALTPSSVRTTTVYTALSRLERDGLIEPSRTADDPSGGQARIVYRATADGEDVLDEWLTKPPTSYDELRARVAVGRPQDLDRLIGYVTAEEQSCLERLRELDTPPIAALASRNAPWDALCGAILGTLDTGELAGRIKWLQDARDALQAFRDHLERTE